jgi:flagellar hook assembly protein FlgD
VRLAVLVALLFSLAAGVARAADVSMVVRDVPLHGSARSLAAAAPRFNMVGLHWQGSGTPLFRTRSAAGVWSGWLAADDDWGRTGGPWRLGNPEWTGTANAIQFRLKGEVRRLRAYYLWSPPVTVPQRRLTIAGAPTIIPRSGWQADESIRRAPPVYAPTLQFALVHHTVNTNSYSCSQSAAMVRGIEIYHVKGNGWNDIGYNFVVDRCGQVFEGRYGGIDKNVVGAHSQGFNTGSVGVALLGTYDTAGATPAQRKALVNLLAWRLDVAHVDPLSFVNFISGGNQKFPAGIPANLRAISGHRDTYFTDCPGNALYAQLPAIAHDVAATGGPKIYSPQAQGPLGGLVRFTAKLSVAQPWTVTVTDQNGLAVATGTGTGTSVDYSWDGTETTLAGRYTWTISSPNALSAAGTLGGKAVALAFQNVSATPPTISPNGDGVDDTATIFYTLTQPAQVTATLVNSTGQAVSTLFTDQKAAGTQSFLFAADSIPDGVYTIGFTATSTGPGGKTVTATVPVTVDRTLAAFAVTPQLLSLAHPPLSATFTLATPTHVTFNILDDAGGFVAQAFDGDLGAGVQTLTWDGSKRVGKLLDGSYQAALVLQEPAGPVTHALPFAADSTPPALKVLSVGGLLRYSLSEDALLTLSLGKRTITRQAKAGLGAFRVVPVPKSFVLTAQDAAGNVMPVAWPTRR